MLVLPVTVVAATAEEHAVANAARVVPMKTMRLARVATVWVAEGRGRSCMPCTCSVGNSPKGC